MNFGKADDEGIRRVTTTSFAHEPRVLFEDGARGKLDVTTGHPSPDLRRRGLGILWWLLYQWVVALSFATLRSLVSTEHGFDAVPPAL